MHGASTTVRDLLERPGRNVASPAIATDAVDSDADYSAFAYGRVSRHVQQAVVFRWADGTARAFAYSYFYGAESGDPDAGFTLDFTQHKVKVQGRNLAVLFRLLCEQRVAEVREADRSQAFGTAADAPIVERLEVAAAVAAR